MLPRRLPAAASLCRRAAARRASSSSAAAAVRSTTDSGVSGSSVYETARAVDEYLQFHYARPADLMPYPPGVAPTAALEFPERCASLCLGAEGRQRRWQRQALRSIPATVVGRR